MKDYPRPCVGVPKINGDIAYQSHLLLLFFPDHMTLILLRLAFLLSYSIKKLNKCGSREKIFKHHLMKKIGF